MHVFCKTDSMALTARFLDLATASLIIMVFFYLYFAALASLKYEEIKRDWDRYKCGMIPVAHVFGKSPTKTLRECVLGEAHKAMPDLLRPVYADLDATSTASRALSEMLGNIRKMLESTRAGNVGFMDHIHGVFGGIGVFLRDLVLRIHDAISKTTASAIVMTHVMSGSLMAVKSTWKGPMGKTVRALA